MTSSFILDKKWKMCYEYLEVDCSGRGSTKMAWEKSFNLHCGRFRMEMEKSLCGNDIGECSKM